MAEYRKVRLLRWRERAEGLLRRDCACHSDGSLLAPADVLDEEKFNVELVVQCIRVSEMPQTHHHALLLLGTVAGIFPVRINDLRLQQIVQTFSVPRGRAH